MARLKTYKCEKCGYSVQTEESGHFSLMSGEYYNFKCHQCKEIISLSADILASQRYHIKCNGCGSDEKLSTWNPIEGRCPKCGGKMEEVANGPIMMAD